jgi:hypothetical protein
MELSQPDSLRCNKPVIWENFYAAFGCVGCLLRCNERKDFNFEQYHNSKKPNHRLWKSMGRTYKDLFFTTFRSFELYASAESGCGTCRTLQTILERTSFLEHSDEKSELDVQYRFSANFTIIRYHVAKDPPRTQVHQVVQIFHPQGKLNAYELFFSLISHQAFHHVSRICANQVFYREILPLSSLQIEYCIG